MKYTKEELQNTYGEVQSLEHAKYISELCESNGIWLFNHYDEGITHFVINRGKVIFTYGEPVISDHDKEITIPIPSKVVETETQEEASEFDRIEMVNRVNNEAEDWPQVGDEVMTSDGRGILMLPADKTGCYIVEVEDNSLGYQQYTIDELSKPKTPEQILTGKVESLIADSLKESNFTGDIGLGDIASIITSNLELYFKVSDL